MTVYKTLFGKPRTFFGAALSLILVLAQVAPANAQVGPATTSADPARAQQRFIEQQDIPDVSPSVEVRSLIQQQAPAGAENIKFTLKEINIEGMTAYSEDALKSVYADKIGTTISLAD